MIALAFYKFGALLVRILPDRFSRLIASCLAEIQFMLRFGIRRNIINNLEIITGGNLGSRELQAMARKVFLNFSESIRLFLKIPHIKPEVITASCDFSEVEALLKRVKHDKGFIMVSAHIGPWELGGMFLAPRGLHINTVVLDHPSRPVTNFFNERREMAQITGYPLEGSFPLLKKSLDRGECVGLLIDRGYHTTSKHYNFFGIPRMLPNSHLLLAARCRVPLVPMAIAFGARNCYKVIMRGPYYIDESKDRHAAMEEAQKKCLADLEEIIRSLPEQYFNFEALYDPLER